MKKNRFKNPWFWIGVVGVVLTAMNVNPTTFTSWETVKEAGVSLISNPYMLGSVAIAVLGVFVDPTTKGITDNKE